jgi:hypothetical protein
MVVAENQDAHVVQEIVTLVSIHVNNLAAMSALRVEGAWLKQIRMTRIPAWHHFLGFSLDPGGFLCLNKVTLKEIVQQSFSSNENILNEGLE